MSCLARAFPSDAFPTYEKKDDKLNVRIPEELKAELVLEAVKRDVSLSRHVTRILRRRDRLQRKQCANLPPDVRQRIGQARQLLADVLQIGTTSDKSKLV